MANLGAFTGACLGVGNRSCVLVAAGPLICARPIRPSRIHGHSSICTQLRCRIRVFLGFRKSKYGNQFACMPSNHFGCERAGPYICICLPEITVTKSCYRRNQKEAQLKGTEELSFHASK
ncbi:hypothetical protein C1H46_041065 [Malus baccata]|uniref:Uncharacterized protein n=1 Tax=Malus baccata TaxID=106549 RepID=A0A540KGN7_MALBA|nr:hypothetical protein C1H46_041065 [Malus baccata]